MKKAGDFTCSNCHLIFYRKFHLVKKGTKHFYCSQDCHYKHELVLTLEKATEQYPESWQKLIYKWYVLEKISMREITRKLKINYRTTQKVFKILNIPQRSAHDRIVLQWKNNKQRKKEQAMKMSESFKGKPGWNKGLTKKSHPSVKKQSEWMTGSNNPMYGRRGKAHPSYKNGKYTSDKKRYWGTSEYRQWRQAVFKRDNYTCRDCGFDKGNILNAHHIKSVKDYPTLIFDVPNGITLCENCHQSIHASIQGEIVHRQLVCKLPPSTVS